MCWAGSSEPTRPACASCFPDDRDAEALGLESYAGFPLTDRHGQPLGTVGVASRKPLNHLERIESMLQIFAVRAAAELEQLRAREALSRSEASYRAIFESAEDAIFIHDWHTGEVLDVNPKACETHGYSREEMRGISLADVSSGVPPYTAEHALAKIQLARLGRCPPFEWHRRNKDGSLHWDEVRLKPAIIDGRAHVLAFARDITERAQLEAQLRQAQKMEAIGQLTGGIAHDFNNILTSVLGYLELGQQRAQTLADAALVRQLGAAELAAQRARDLIAQMLTFARRQRGERRVLALAPLVRQSLQLLRSTLPASVVVDAATLDGSTREDGDLSVMADAVQIEQVLFNLCINARDAIEGPVRSACVWAPRTAAGLAPPAAHTSKPAAGSRSAWPTAAAASPPKSSSACSSRSSPPRRSAEDRAWGSRWCTASSMTTAVTSCADEPRCGIVVPRRAAVGRCGRTRCARSHGAYPGARAPAEWPRAGGRGRADGGRLHGRAARRLGTAGDAACATPLRPAPGWPTRRMRSTCSSPTRRCRT